MRADFIQLLQASAWPVAAVIGLLLLRKPIAVFLEGLAPRLTKISAFKVELELKAASDLSHPSVTALAEIANVPSVTSVGDSAGRLLAAFGDPTPSDFMEIDLGEGEEWLTTRIFILAAQMERLRGLRCIVFLETSGGASRRLVGMASLGAVRWSFAMRWPFLEQAYAEAYRTLLADGQWWGNPPVAARVVSGSGAVPPAVAQEIFRQYLRPSPPSVALRVSAQSPPASSGGYSFQPDEWLDLGESDAPPAGPLDHEWERAEWVSGQMLQQVLGSQLHHACVIDSLEATPEKIARAVLRQTAPFVARLRPDLSFDTIVDRVRLATRMAESSGQS